MYSFMYAHIIWIMDNLSGLININESILMNIIGLESQKFPRHSGKEFV